MFLILSSLSLLGYMYYDRTNMMYQSLKAYSILEDRLNNYLSTTDVVLVSSEILDDSKEIKYNTYNYNNKIYRMFMESKDTSENIKIPYKSPLLSISLTIKEDKKILIDCVDVTEFINSFIIQNESLFFINDYDKYWLSVLKYNFNEFININYNQNLKFTWNIIDENAEIYSSNNIILELKNNSYFFLFP